MMVPKQKKRVFLDHDMSYTQAQINKQNWLSFIHMCGLSEEYKW